MIAVVDVASQRNDSTRGQRIITHLILYIRLFFIVSVAVSSTLYSPLEKYVDSLTSSGQMPSAIRIILRDCQLGHIAECRKSYQRYLFMSSPLKPMRPPKTIST